MQLARTVRVVHAEEETAEEGRAGSTCCRDLRLRERLLPSEHEILCPGASAERTDSCCARPRRSNAWHRPVSSMSVPKLLALILSQSLARMHTRVLARTRKTHTRADLGAEMQGLIILNWL